MDDLPRWVQERMENVAVVVDDVATPGRLRELGYDPTCPLLGLYEGVNRVARAAGYHGAIPDRITLFRQTIIDQVGTAERAALSREIRKTLIHEVAHHFGYDDPEIARLERGG